MKQRRMFNIQIRIALWAVLFLLATACNDDPFGRNGSDKGVLEIGVSHLNGMLVDKTATRATNDGDPDNRVKTLRVLAFNHQTGALSYTQKVDVADGATDPVVKMEMLEGTYDIVAICNETAALATRLSAVSQRTGLNNLSLAADAFGNAVAIPMVGEVSQSINEAGYTEVDGKQVYRLDIDVERIATRLDLKVLTTPGDADAPATGKLTKLVLKGFPDQIALMPGTTEAYSRTDATLARTLTDTDFAETETGKTPAGYETEQLQTRVIVPSWLFAPDTKVENALAVEATFATGQELKGILSYTTEPGAVKHYTLNRNTIHHLTITGRPKRLEVEATIEPWTVKDLTGIVGKVYEFTSNMDKMYFIYRVNNMNGETLPDQYGPGYQKAEYSLLKAHLKFFTKNPPYTFTVKNDKLGTITTLRLDDVEGDIEIPVDPNAVLTKEKDLCSPENEAFWGFPISPFANNNDETSSLKYRYHRFYRTLQKTVYTLEDITDGSGQKLPSMDLSECKVATDLTFVPYLYMPDPASGGFNHIFWTTHAKPAVFTNDAGEQDVNLPGPYFATVSEAETFCKGLGTGEWRLPANSAIHYLLAKAFIPSSKKEGNKLYGWVSDGTVYKSEMAFMGMGPLVSSVSWPVPGSYYTGDASLISVADAFNGSPGKATALCIREEKTNLKIRFESGFAINTYKLCTFCLLDDGTTDAGVTYPTTLRVMSYGGIPPFGFDLAQTVGGNLRYTYTSIATREKYINFTLKHSDVNWGAQGFGYGVKQDVTFELQNPTNSDPTLSSSVDPAAGSYKTVAKRTMVYKGNGYLWEINTKTTPKMDLESARSYCQSTYGSGWFLPSLNEFWAVWGQTQKDRDKLSDEKLHILEGCSGDAYNSTGGYPDKLGFWLSDETYLTKWIGVIYFKNTDWSGGHGFLDGAYEKAGVEHNVLCVRKWTE